MTSALRDHLQKIYDEHEKLTADLLVDEARDEESPLHSRFEWDDTIAGEKYRKVQANELIRSVEIVYHEDANGAQQKVRAFHSVTRADGTTYVPVDDIRQDDFLRKLALQSAEREWKALQRKYAHLKEFMDIVRSDLAS